MTEPAPIFIDARTVRPGMSGVGRYAYNILAALASRPDHPPLRAMFLPDSLPLAVRDASLKGVECVEARFSHEDHPRGDWWLEYDLPKTLKPGEVYHGPAFLMPGGRRDFARVVTVHDLFVFTHAWAYPRKFAIWLRWATRRACRTADRIIVPSQVVAGEIIDRDLAPAEKIAVIPYAPDATPETWESDETHEAAVANAGQDGEPRLVTIATLDPRKDPTTAREALTEFHRRFPSTAPRLRWSWIGGPGPLADSTPKAVIERAEKLGFATTGALPNSMARRMLAEAAALVTCSRAEGFGIPLAEALAAATPIIATDIPIHREVAGDAALYFPAGDAAALAVAIHRLLTEPGLAAALKERARDRAAKFTWQSAARITLEAYRDARAASQGSKSRKN